jgi:hypothetical protein
MERRSFFSASIDQEDLERKARSTQEIDRWFAAVALAQIHEPWAFERQIAMRARELQLSMRLDLFLSIFLILL